MEGSPSSHSSTSGTKSPVLRRRHSLRKTVDGWEEENTHPSSQRPSLSWDDHPYYAAQLSDGNAVVDFYDDLSQRLYSSTDMTSDDPMTVIDESFFFLDYLASPSTSKPVPATSTTSNYRVSFNALLTDCHDHRMSTIKEASPSTERAFRLPSPTAKGKGPELLLDPAPPATIPSSSVVSNDASMHTPRLPPTTRPETMSKKKHPTQQSNTKTNPIQKERNGLQKLLDYIIPYPTRNLSSSRKSVLHKPRLVRPSHRPPETHSDRTSLADDDGDGEWVLHGFFEISRS